MAYSNSDDEIHVRFPSEQEEFPEESNDETRDFTEDSTENLTVKQVQEELIERHPFGIKIWKPALYKKHRSIDKQTYEDLHTIPGSMENDVSPGNILWCILFGWWIAFIYVVLALAIIGPFYLIGHLAERSLYSPRWIKDLSNLKDYSLLLLNLAGYIFWPFGKFISKKEVIEHALHEDLHLPSASMPLMFNNDYDISSRSASHNEDGGRERHGRWTSDVDSDSQFDHSNSTFSRTLNLLRKIYKSGISGMLFFLICVLILGPIHLLTSGIMFFFVLPIPMAKLNYYLFRHILRHPLLLSAHYCDDLHQGTSQRRSSRTSGQQGSGGLRPPTSPPVRPRSIFFWRFDSSLLGEAADVESFQQRIPTIMTTPSLGPYQSSSREKEYQIVLCTYRAMGLEYTRYTVDGINIIFVNLLFMIIFTFANYYILGPSNGYTGISSKPVIFLSGIVSTIPLSYFIGMAVSGITAQTGSVAVGSVVNATFGSIIEILLYAFGLMDGKEDLVQGAMIGSFLLGLLALPGVSMFFGGLKKAEQRFNAKSASVTSTMLVVAIICVFTPTIFQNIHGTYQFQCTACPEGGAKCRNCQIFQPHPTEDPIYINSTRPLMYICAVTLILTYAVGLWFTLRTHSKRIYGKKRNQRKRYPIPELHLDTNVSPNRNRVDEEQPRRATSNPVYDTHRVLDQRDTILQRRMGKMPTSASGVSHQSNESIDSSSSDESGHDEEGHSNPGWGIVKSGLILLACTVVYSIIAEILIDAIDEIIEVFPIREKTLGLTIFAIVPTVTEFYNAISFAMKGNIVLALEIGSAYAIQVALLQIPVLVAFSAWWNYGLHSVNDHPLGNHHAGNVRQSRSQFTLVFPQWEFYCLAFSVFLLTYVYLEGKSNYFKGALLLLTYIVLISAFFFEPS